MPSTVETVEEHVPAWKKLGLKLKNANDKTAGTVDVTVGQAPSKNNKRKLPIGDLAEQTTTPPPSASPAKKPRKSTSKPSKSPVTASQDTTSPASAPQENSVFPPATRISSLHKTKSVSFAPQTKTEDADSTKDLYNTWLTSQLASDPSFDPSKTASPALKSITPTSVSDPTATVNPTSSRDPKKKRKKSKSTILSQPPSKSGPTEAPALNKATLEYLQTYHTDRANWKFSKTRQTQLLRCLFSAPQTPSLIPPTRLPALHAYLSGLQGPSARSRLRTQALAVREEDEKWLNEDMEAVENKERRKEEYMREVERVKELLKGVEDEREDREKLGSKEWWEKVQRRRMAEVVLWSVGEQGQPKEEEGRKAEEITGNQARTIGGGTGEKRPLGKNGKPKRKRKRRTTGVPDDDSSSSSSSSSSDDDDSDEEETTKGKATDDDSDTPSSEESSSEDSESGDGGGSESGDGSGSSGSGSGSGSESDSNSGSDSGSG